MHNTMNIIRHLAIGLCLLAAPTLTGCSLADWGLAEPTARILDVSIMDVGLATTPLLFDVEVDNPYSIDLPLTDLDYVLASDGESFLRGIADLDETIPAGGSRTLPIPIMVDYVKLLDALQDIRPGSTVPYTADIGISVTAPLAGAIRVPAKYEGLLTVPSLPGWE